MTRSRYSPNLIHFTLVNCFFILAYILYSIIITYLLRFRRLRHFQRRRRWKRRRRQTAECKKVARAARAARRVSGETCGSRFGYAARPLCRKTARPQDRKPSQELFLGLLRLWLLLPMLQDSWQLCRKSREKSFWGGLRSCGLAVLRHYGLAALKKLLKNPWFFWIIQCC